MERSETSLPDTLAQWVQNRVKLGNFTNVSEYIGKLVEHDESQSNEFSWLQGEIDNGLASGIDPRQPSQIFDAIRVKNIIA